MTPLTYINNNHIINLPLVTCSSSWKYKVNMKIFFLDSCLVGYVLEEKSFVCFFVFSFLYQFTWFHYLSLVGAQDSSRISHFFLSLHSDYEWNIFPPGSTHYDEGLASMFQTHLVFRTNVQFRIYACLNAKWCCWDNLTNVVHNGAQQQLILRELIMQITKIYLFNLYVE